MQLRYQTRDNLINPFHKIKQTTWRGNTIVIITVILW